jgi:hypothetical protein
MRKAIAILCVVLLPGAGTLAVAQPPGPPPDQPFDQQAPGPGPAQPPAQLMSPQQVENLVAPIALYPDPLLGQVLAASTYPLEIVEAQQWMQQHRELRGQQLTDAARQQNWDASVQALVAFPEAMALLTRDIRWTTDLGNAFLAQQTDVMNAIQRMRARAQQNGRLRSSPQERVTGPEGAIQIQPADPQVIYVPVYNPMYVWGAPGWGFYPPLWYPSFGFGFGPAIFLGGFFGGFLGFGGWGWGCNWFGHGLFVNGLFFNHYGYRGYGAGYGARGAWAHNPAHRMGVAYPNRATASRFGSTRYSGSTRYNASSRGAAGNSARSFNGGRSSAGPSSSARSYNGGQSRSFNNGGARSYIGGQSRSFNNGGTRSYSAPRSQSFNANRGAPSQMGRGFSSPQSRSYSAPRSGGSQQQHYSAPRSSGGGGSHYSAPRSSGGGHAPSGGGGHSGGGGSRRR